MFRADSHAGGAQTNLTTVIDYAPLLRWGEDEPYTHPSSHPEVRHI
jgi:hypothetical protein